MRKLTLEEFIEKARGVHGDKYDYSKVEYVNSKTKVCIICPEHGEFWQRPNDLLNGVGCPKCAGTCKMTREEFIEKSKIVHNNFFSYKNTLYKNSNEKVLVTCPIHGDFEVKANNHLKGVNCKLCEKEGVRHEINKLEQVNKSTLKYDTLTFIEKCKEIHGNKYTYEETIYNGNSKKVIVTCPTHGNFEIRANHLLSGRGCSKCAKNYKYSTEEIIEKFKTIHGDKYDYSKVEYTKTHDKVIVVCPEHGEFKITPSNHLKGCGCSKCNKKSHVKVKKINTNNKNKVEHFIEKARKVHGDKYDYSKVEYVNCETKVCIICPEHGEFWQIPYSHLSGCGCKNCGQLKSNIKKRLTLEEFIEKAREIHGDKYDYSKVKYVDSKTKVCIICPEHGEFWQTPSSHLSGCGCKNCYENKKKKLFNLTKEEFIEKAKEVHGDKYDYSKVEYVNARIKVCIICPEHGEFWQTPSSHLSGCGCKNCGYKTIAEKIILTKEQFITTSKELHGNKYNYDKSEYISARDKILIECPEHGEFWQIADAHMRGCGCPVCGNLISKPENEIYQFIKENTNVFIEQRNRNLIKPYELDLYIPEYNFAIEYNGLYWHSSKFLLDKKKHLDKLIRCQENSIKLINIFEDEWINKKDIVLSKIKHLLHIENNPKIMARKTDIKIINSVDGVNFLKKYHIQGSGVASVYLGCFYNEKLVSVMSFKKEKKDTWELTRFASDYNYTCQGIGGKLFKYFIRNYNPEIVKSFADRRWTIDEKNNLYVQLGFKFEGYTPPDYKYIKSGKFERYHKFNFRKKILLKKHSNILNEKMTESEMTKKLGYLKIYDCGLIKYIWKKEK